MARGYYHRPEFFVNCTATPTTTTDINFKDAGQPEPLIGPMPYLMMDNHTSLRVTNISLDGKLHVLQPIARKCIGDEYQTNSSLYLPNSFTISDTKNKFFAIGCGTAASFEGRRRSPKLGHGGPGKERHLHASGYSFALMQRRHC